MRDHRSYAEALLGLRMTDDAPAFEVLKTLAQGRDHLRVSEDLQRLDDALVELPRQDREYGLAAARDRGGAPRRSSELLREVQQSLPRFGNCEFGHRRPRVHSNVQ